jgi:hypothetical protein
MDSFAMFGFIFGLMGFVLGTNATAKFSQLKKEVEELRNRLPEHPPAL